MNDDVHLSISVSEFCYCVHLIIVMAQLSTEIKKLFLIQMEFKPPELMCFTDNVLKENMLTMPPFWFWGFIGENFLHYK